MPCALDSGREIALALGAVTGFFSSFDSTAVGDKATDA
jgi:hypothetical protein